MRKERRLILPTILLDIYDYIESNSLHALSQTLSTSDLTCDDSVRCHCFVMENGQCLRVNTTPLYMDANRLVSEKCSKMFKTKTNSVIFLFQIENSDSKDFTNAVRDKGFCPSNSQREKISGICYYE